MSFERKLDQVLGRFKEIEAVMSTGSLESDEFTKLSKEYADMSSLAEFIVEYKKAKKEQDDLESLISDPQSDKEMKDLANEDFYRLKDEIFELEKKIQLALIPKDDADEKNAILEIRAGTGGDEASLFALDLLGMYRNYSSDHGWKFEIMEISENDLGGVKQSVIQITGRGVFARLKYESGVHRVQRVPDTETQGRVHTSAATVAVLPEAEEVDMNIKTEDLRIDVYRASGAGGQHVNKTESAVRITHLPTGVVVQQQDSSSQHSNRDKAMKILRSRLYDKKRQELDSERSANRKEQIGSGDRSGRIRTYNFPQGRVTDHRINLTLYKIDKIIAGEALDEIVDALTAEEQAEKLAEISW